MQALGAGLKLELWAMSTHLITCWAYRRRVLPKQDGAVLQFLSTQSDFLRKWGWTSVCTKWVWFIQQQQQKKLLHGHAEVLHGKSISIQLVGRAQICLAFCPCYKQPQMFDSVYVRVVVNTSLIKEAIKVTTDSLYQSLTAAGRMQRGYLCNCDTGGAPLQYFLLEKFFQKNKAECRWSLDSNATNTIPPLLG